MTARSGVANGVTDDSGLTVLEIAEQKEERSATPKRRRGAAGARKAIVDAMPDMAKALIEEAKKGSMPHLKLAFELAGGEKATSRSAAKPVYSQRIERQLLKELETMFPTVEVGAVGDVGWSSTPRDGVLKTQF